MMSFIPGENDAFPSSSKWMRSLARVGMALSLAHLCLIRAWYSALYPAGDGYYNQLPVNFPLLAGLFLNLLLLTLIFKIGIFAVRTNPRIWPRRLAIILMGMLLLIPFNFIRLQYFHISGASMISLMGHPAVMGCSVVAVALAWRWYAVVATLVRGILLILLPFALWTLLLLVHLAGGLICQPLAPPGELASLLTVKAGHPRVVWLIFDELDYRVVFEKCPPGVALPEFDRLRSESLFATRATEPGANTILSMPALLNGQHVAFSEPASANDLRVTFSNAPEPKLWSTTTTVFSQARELGYNTAIVAWYHPYRRLFGRDLNYCSDYPLPLYEQARGRTLGQAMANQLWSTLAPIQQRRLTLQVYQNGLGDALQIATNPVYGLSLLHLMGPHEPGIYQPARNRFTVTSFSTVEGYFNNLVLTDRTLGQLRRAMENAGVWDSSWLIISADHCWRKSNLYDGKIDHRVPFIVKAPDAKVGSGQEMEFPFDTVMTHDLLLAILRGKVTDSRSAIAWCQAIQ
jgi:hypothetical protein